MRLILELKLFAIKNFAYRLFLAEWLHINGRLWGSLRPTKHEKHKSDHKSSWKYDFGSHYPVDNAMGGMFTKVNALMTPQVNVKSTQKMQLLRNLLCNSYSFLHSGFYLYLSPSPYVKNHHFELDSKWTEQVNDIEYDWVKPNGHFHQHKRSISWTVQNSFYILGSFIFNF